MLCGLSALCVDASLTKSSGNRQTLCTPRLTTTLQPPGMTLASVAANKNDVKTFISPFAAITAKPKYQNNFVSKTSVNGTFYKLAKNPLICPKTCVKTCPVIKVLKLTRVLPFDTNTFNQTA
jgi:hypothetical protein